MTPASGSSVSVAAVDRERRRLLDDLSEFIAIPSVSTTKADMTPAVDFLLARLEAAGCDARSVATEGNPVVYGEWGPADAATTVLIYGHYDVFPADDTAGWNTDPFEATIRGDRIYGRGAGDNKGQVLAHIEALELLSGSLAFDGYVRVKLVIEGEEEIGSPSLPVFVREHSEMLAADLCFYSDGPMFPGKQPVLLFGVRGAVVVEITVRGARRDLHSGNFGGVAPTPSMDLCRLLACMVEPDGRMALPGLKAGIPSMSDAEREAIARLPSVDGLAEEMGVPDAHAGSDRGPYERLLLHPHLNICSIHAGPTDGNVHPAIPSETSAIIDLRLVGEQDPDAVVAAIETHVRELGPLDSTVRKIVAQPASKTPMDTPWTATVVDAVRVGFERDPLLVPGLAATTPEYVFTKLLDVPTVCVPYAPHDESNHAVNESTSIDLYLRGIATTAELLLHLGAGAGSGSRA